MFFIFFNFNNNFASLFLSLASSVSNIGLSLNDSPENLTFVFLILSIIGGSLFSTSSGIRFLKLYALFKYSINDMISHVKTKNVFINKHIYLKINFEKKEVDKYFLSLIIFIISLLFLTSLLTISGINFEDGFKLAILTLMNTVNSDMYGLENFEFQELHFFTKYYLIIFMIIGRVELLTFLIICKKIFFKS